MKDLKSENMQKLLEEIKEIERTTGLRIIDNIWDYGSCAVVDENNKVFHRGGHIDCRIFINKFYFELIKTENKIR